MDEDAQKTIWKLLPIYALTPHCGHNQIMVTRDEVLDLIEKLKKDKPSGPDGVNLRGGKSI